MNRGKGPNRDNELSGEQYRIVRLKQTEPPYTGKYLNHFERGTYLCVACDTPLFSSETKYEAYSGWPSFWAPYNESAVITELDKSHGMARTEIKCGNCHAHLGHVFEDGPKPTGLRYCTNSLALKFSAKKDT